MIEALFTLRFPSFALEADISFPMQGITALFGPSGSGKTSLLRCMAGLEKAVGFMAVGGEVWQDDRRGIFLPTHRRSLGYVFQEASLFPHLSVRANLEYGRRRADHPLNDTEREATLELLGIHHLLDRKPDRLSGGERQRVAIARALLRRPRLLLMDEPLASLDMRRRLEILPYLERLHEELRFPVVYVSHSPDEVARLADHMIILEEGRVLASGPLREILGRIDLGAVFAEDEGVALDGRIAEHTPDGLSRLDFDGGSLFVARRPEELGHTIRCVVHARDVSLALSNRMDTSILNVLPAIIDSMAPINGGVLVRLKIGDTNTVLIARITERSRRHLSLVAGMHVYAQVKAVALLS